MGVSSGYVSAPVSVSDVKTALGESSNDVGTLCKSAKINKWSQCKPVRNASVGALTLSQFRDTPSVGGIQTRYGMKCYTEGTIFQAHLCDFTYYPPTGGAASPFRLTDFNTYTHSGKPEFTGDFWSDGGKVDPASGSLALGLRMQYDSSGNLVPSNHAVSLATMVGNNVTIDNLASYYVCCMLSAVNGNIGTNWVRCCTNTQKGERTPVKYNGAYYYMFHAGLDGAPAAAIANGTHAVTFFLIQSQSGVLVPPTAWAQWTAVSQSLIVSNPWIAIPEAVRKTVTFTSTSGKFVINLLIAYRDQDDELEFVYTVQANWSFIIDDGSNGGFVENIVVAPRIQLKVGSATAYDQTESYTVDSSPHIVSGTVKAQSVISGASSASIIITYQDSSLSKTCEVVIRS